ncbi:amidohydrolase family protein [Stieleria sp. TO1_6]|uniref:amidohydrolase family protein n=1 Tax=Stieleria tagensis TaxID=2956795 RepID=UPI00209ACBF7|nr:amidohydrolase family protein [Stieleria tagensis]MCO8125225.1 amidohydrolase family protein [Stieleria tagensis]
MREPRASLILSLMCVLASSFATAQDAADTRPTVGLAERPDQTFLLQNARVVTRPGEILESASVLIQATSITKVGADLEPPVGAKLIDLSGKTIYAGLIDAFAEIDVPDPPSGVADHWNGNVVPRRAAASSIKSLDDLAKLRSQGFTMRLLAPQGAIVKGSSCLVMLSGNNSVSLVKDNIAQHLQLTVPRSGRRHDYPNSPMGAVALVRQTLADALWYETAWKTYAARPEIERPIRNDDLARLATDLTTGRFVIDAPNERMAVRAESVAREFSLDFAIRGSGREYRDLTAIANTGRMLLIPVDFPSAPAVASEAAAADVPLRDLMHWHFAPENPARLESAGARFCITADGLDDPTQFLKQMRKAVSRGLSEDAALAAVTTTPADWLGVEDVAGRVRPGALANLVITDGPLFDEKTKVLETWVAGKRFEIEPPTSSQTESLAGNWQTEISTDQGLIPLHLALSVKKSKWTGKLSSAPKDAQDNSEQPSDEDSSKQQPKTTPLKDLARASDRLTAWTDLSTLDERLPTGASRITMITLATAADSSPTIFSTLTKADGSTIQLQWQRSKEDPVEPDAAVDADTQETTKADTQADSTQSGPAEIQINSPLGGFGTVQPVTAPPAVLFRGATVWTCGPSGVIKDTDILVVDGKIKSVQAAIDAPANCTIVDASGKHISPGLIDCHSHMATDGGVNESGQAVTAEVRIGDFIDPSDINIYRQLAGGLTCANILHGSANPIGGQNQVIKLRWGDAMDAMKLDAAPSGIKFALGENVKRSNHRTRSDRYPSSRMGVQELFRDRFLAAQAYHQQRSRWLSGQRRGLPPRRDLELEAIAEILNGQRWIHCHSYRQDEIVALLDVLDEFEITIGTLQHILEGYKVADRMLAHGAMASSFSDWWAYKFEVYDAIPHNGAIMHDVGIVVSFNSDDAELARHLNTEAAKATKYGGVAAEEALKFVTLNPAKQLRIDDRVGSIEPGKDADLVLWNGPPLSTLSRCQQTWVDGRLLFSIERDQELRERDQRWRAILVQKILDDPAAKDGRQNDDSNAEEDRWLRYDEFCHQHEHSDDEHGDEHAAEHQHEHAENNR